MVTTKEIGIEYTQKKMRKTFKHFTTKQTQKITQEMRNKTISYIKNKHHNDRNSSFISLIQVKQIKLSNEKRLAEWTKNA